MSFASRLIDVIQVIAADYKSISSRVSTLESAAGGGANSPNIRQVNYTTTVPDRPNSPVVYWVGAVDPAAKAQPNDQWIPTQ